MDKLQVNTPQTPATNETQPQSKSHVDVTLKWGGSVIGVQRISHLGEITIGDGEGTSFNISDATIPSAKFALVTLCSEGVRLHIAPGMKLVVNEVEHEQSCFDLALGEQARVSVGALEFVVQYTTRNKGLRVPLLKSIDHLYAQVFSFAMILQLAVIGAMLLTPHFGEDSDDDLNVHRNDFDLSVQTPQRDKTVPKEAAGKKAARHKDKEGVFGKRRKKIQDTLAAKKGSRHIEKDKRAEAQKLAESALANMGLGGETLASDTIFGAGGTGINAGLDGLAGASLGSTGGLGGQGTRGNSYGGGGNTLSIGVLGSGEGRGIGRGREGVDVGRKGKGTTRVRPGDVVLVGAMSRAEIQRVLRRAKSRIRYCYEKELQKNPNLQGKLVLRWSIGPTGKVATAKSTQNTLKNAQVSACVKRVVKGLEFPEPRGGGKVFVTYPWVFSSK